VTLSGLRHLWLHRRVSLIAFVAACLLAGVFLFRFAVATVYWSDVSHLEQVPAPWMTPGYVARSWNVDPHEVATALGLDPDAPPRGRTLADIAEAQGVPTDVLIGELTTYLSDARR
jgi:hypothetical protein